MNTKRQPSRGVDADALTRLPPHSLEAEQGVLGCILIAGNKCLAELQSAGFGQEQFFHLPHRVIYDSMCRVAGSDSVDLLLLVEELKRKGYLEGVGGITYLITLQEAVPSAANLTYYSDIVTEKHLLRQMLRAASDLSEEIHNNEGDVQSLITRFQQKALAIGSWKKGGFIDAKAFVQTAIDFIEERHKAAAEGKVIGIPTGIHPIDKMLSGMQDGDFIVIAARPSVGKTSMLWQICENVAVNQGLPVGIFSLEMSAKSLGARALYSMAGVASQRGLLTERDFPKLSSAAAKLAASKLHIDEQAGIPIGTLRARARQMKQLHGVRMIGIDYLQLIHGDGRSDSREREVASVSQGIKEMAKELSIPVIALAQIGREQEKRGTKPRMSDLRESGSIEADVDAAIALYKPDPDAENSECVQTNALIMKQRNGPTGDVPLVFMKRTTRFEEMAIQ